MHCLLLSMHGLLETRSHVRIDLRHSRRNQYHLPPKFGVLLFNRVEARFEVPPPDPLSVSASMSTVMLVAAAAHASLGAFCLLHRSMFGMRLFDSTIFASAECVGPDRSLTCGVVCRSHGCTTRPVCLTASFATPITLSMSHTPVAASPTERNVELSDEEVLGRELNRNRQPRFLRPFVERSDPRVFGRLVGAERVCDRVHVRRLRRDVLLRELVITMMVVLSVRVDD